MEEKTYSKQDDVNEEGGTMAGGAMGVPGGTSTGSAGLDVPAGQFVKGIVGNNAKKKKEKNKVCEACGYDYIMYSETTKCPSCTLTNMRTNQK